MSELSQRLERASIEEHMDEGDPEVINKVSPRGVEATGAPPFIKRSSATEDLWSDLGAAPAAAGGLPPPASPSEKRASPTFADAEAVLRSHAAVRRRSHETMKVVAVPDGRGGTRVALEVPAPERAPAAPEGVGSSILDGLGRVSCCDRPRAESRDVAVDDLRDIPKPPPRPGHQRLDSY